MPHRILLADDHEGIRRRVRSALEDAGFDVCGEAANGQEAVRQTKELMPDLIVLNLSMPIMNGLEALPQIAKSVPSAKVLDFYHGRWRRTAERSSSPGGARLPE